jgi:hypothetical protein
MTGTRVLFLSCLLVLLTTSAWGQEPPAPVAAPAPAVPPEPPRDLTITGETEGIACRIEVTWKASPTPEVTGYLVRRSEYEGEFVDEGEIGPTATSYVDESCEFGVPYRYQVVAKVGTAESAAAAVGPLTTQGNWIDWSKASAFAIGVIVCAAILYFIAHARSGKKLFVRKIAGLEAVDEAIGRATEMGKPILFVPGIMDMNDVQTVAAVIILGRIAKTIAEYDTRLYVPTSKSLVMTTARETVKESYIAAGRPDAYRDDMITYLTDEQFGYVAGVGGIMVREKPATCFYLGSFYAESLILAETGNAIGAIQVAGTAQPSQLPFFIAACDYTLIGEELFAASAYLSHEPMQLGSLKGQDVGKALAMAAIGIGVILQTGAALLSAPWIQTANAWFLNLFAVQP